MQSLERPKQLLERLKQLDKHISLLQKILKDGEYCIAGFKIDLYVGENMIGDTFSFGIPSNVEKLILESMVLGLERTKEYYTRELKKEANAIKEYLEINSND